MLLLGDTFRAGASRFFVMTTALAPVVPLDEQPQATRKDPRNEYVVPYGGLGGGASALSAFLDEIQRDAGSLIYERMQETDAEIAKCIELILISTLGDGVEFAPAVPDDHPKYKKAVKINEFLARSWMSHIETSPRQFLYEQLKGALTIGNKVGEITLKDGNGQDDGKYVLRSLKTKPRGSIAYVVDHFFNILGFLGTQYVTGDVGDLVAYQSVPTDKRLMIRRDKFSVLSLRTMDADPRGGSWLRPVYNAYALKKRTFPEWLRWLMVCAIPTVVGVCAPDNAQREEPMIDPRTNQVVMADGKPVNATPMQVMANRLAQWRNALAMAIPNGADVKKIETSSDGRPFTDSIDALNGEIDTGLIFHPLIAREGRFMARAAQAGAMSVFDFLVYWLRMLMIETSIRDVNKLLVEENFGPDSLWLMSNVTMGDTERRAFDKDAMGVAQLANAHWFDDYSVGEKEDVSRMIGLPARAIPEARRTDRITVVNPMPKPAQKSGGQDGEQDPQQSQGGNNAQGGKQ